MSDTITVFIAGTPKAQPRARAFATKIGGKYTARVFNPSSAEGWKSCIAIAVGPHLPASPIEGPVRRDVDFILPRPKCLSRKKDPDGEIRHFSKPDIDNLDKSLLDALTQVGMFKDDCQVCEGEPRKFYAAKGAPSGARLRITSLEPVTGPIDQLEPATGGK